jgi:PIN domain nuclease of toxin-antitoxin system
VPGILLDTNALIWVLAGQPIEADAALAIADAQAADELFVSPVSAWEAALAVRHRNPDRRPNLSEQDAATWFRKGRARLGAKLAAIGIRVALEAARIPSAFSHSDPGDCFLIATAHSKRLAFVTRDGPIRDLATANPGYLSVIRC